MGIHCIVVTPEKTALEETADLVVVPLIDGELGIQQNHSPLIGRLGYGELRISVAGKTSNYYVDGGFVQVSDNQVSVITGRAVPVSEINLAKAQKMLADAEAQIGSNGDLLAIKEKALQRARAQIRLATR
jgi:F-type H+-transporting ATPase subunit epsilon